MNREYIARELVNVAKDLVEGDNHSPRHKVGGKWDKGECKALWRAIEILSKNGHKEEAFELRVIHDTNCRKW